jgi:hypothetical protein
VAQGATLQLRAAEFQSEKERNLWLFDSFEGCQDQVRRTSSSMICLDSDRWPHTKERWRARKVKFQRKLASINFPHRTKIKKGWVKDPISSGELPTQIAFAYIHLDFYDPIKDTLHFVDSRMPMGATSLWIVDDYG